MQDLYSWIGTFHSVPAHFSIVLDKGRILKDLNQPLCQIGNHIVVEVLVGIFENLKNYYYVPVVIHLKKNVHLYPKASSLLQKISDYQVKGNTL